MSRIKELKPKQIKQICRLIIFISLGIVTISARFNLLLPCIGELVFMIFACIIDIIFYRCPACGKYLGRVRVDYCRNCGKKL